MSELIEKALTTLLALIIVVAVGIPTINSGVNITADGYKLALVRDLLERLDIGIRQVIHGEWSYFSGGYFPDNLKIRSEGSTIIAEYYALGRWNTESRVYSVPINLSCQVQSGPCQIIVFRQGSVIYVNFKGGTNHAD